jgi:hypothetical protein
MGVFDGKMVFCGEFDKMGVFDGKMDVFDG